MSMKKKALMAASYVMVAAMAVGGTVAYLTDREEAVNVMTLGNVDIKLVEQQRDETGKAFEDFEDGKKLLPIVGSAQTDQKVEIDGVSLTTAKNYVDKVVSVDNIGITEAYVRVVVAVPAELEETGNANGPLHWNVTSDYDTYIDLTWEDAPVSIGGIEYNLYTFTYTDAIAAGDDTPVPAFIGFYLDSEVDYDDEKGCYTYKGKDITYNLDDVMIPVQAQAVQAAGFTSATEAFTASKMPSNPWAANTTAVESEDGLVSAVGASVVKGEVVLEDTTTELYNNVALCLDDATITANRSDSTTAGAASLSVLTVYDDVTIGGEGSVENTGEGYAITVRDDDASLTITDGTYTGSTTAINVVKGDLVITGGTFIDADADGGTSGTMKYENGHYLINCIDANYRDGSATVTIKGGTFKNFDPSNNAAEGAGTNFVADGYTVVSETDANGDVWYTVVEAK